MNPIQLLLIEDDRIDQLAFRRYVEEEKLPYQFDMVTSIAQARSLLATRSFDLIITDYNLGDGDATDVCSLAVDTPVIIITGAGNEETAVRVLKAGAHDYIIKDADRNYLKVLPLTVEKAVQSHRASAKMKMLLHALMHINDSVYITDTNGIIQFVNASFCRTYGYLVDDVQGQPASILEGAVEEGECEHLRKDGTKFFVSLSKSVVRGTSGEIGSIVTVARDITAQKQAEEALRSSEEKYRRFFNEDLAGAYIAEPDGRLRSCNPSFARIFGFDSVNEALRYNLVGLYPKSRQFAELCDLLKLNRRLEYHEIELRRSDGEPVHVIQNVIGKFDDANCLIEIKGYIFDNTRHKLLEEQLRQAQKMESIGTLAGGIAHDFNNILAIIMGHIHILRQGKDEMIRRANSLETIDKAAHRGAKLVKQILTFARRDEVTFEAVDMNTLVTDLQRMLSETFPKIIEFNVKLDPALPATVADPDQVHQALLNLCVNARDAMPGGGTLTLETELVRGMYLRERFSEANEHMYVCIRVSDTGTGMPPDILSRMFEPFFTTKDIGKGTGLGLAVVYGVLKSHKGIVDVTSEMGKGSTFILYLPIRHEEVETDYSEGTTLTDVNGQGETILVVEDEAMLLDLVKGMLEGRGYNVLAAMDGVEAIEIFENNKEEIGLVLIDLGLPKIDGWEAYQRMRELDPDVKVIIASGYIDPSLRANLLSAGVLDLVQKPYMPQEILTRVRELIRTPQLQN